MLLGTCSCTRTQCTRSRLLGHGGRKGCPHLPMSRAAASWASTKAEARSRAVLSRSARSASPSVAVNGSLCNNLRKARRHRMSRRSPSGQNRRLYRGETGAGSVSRHTPPPARTYRPAVSSGARPAPSAAAPSHRAAPPHDPAPAGAHGPLLLAIWQTIGVCSLQRVRILWLEMAVRISSSD